MPANSLDNSIWNAMISGSSHLAVGNDEVKFFPEDIAPFAGMKNYTESLFRQLHDMIPGKRRVVIFAVNRLEIPGYWKIADKVDAIQMIYESGKPPSNNDNGIITLEIQDIAEMIALTELTHPGPFQQRTIKFGNYCGIFKDKRLIAMAGQRMHVNEYVEISAVCTHPDQTGRGYAAALINDQVEKTLSAGNIPFLHVRADNKNAINLYKRLGFTVRADINIYVLQKQEPYD